MLPLMLDLLVAEMDEEEKPEKAGAKGNERDDFREVQRVTNRCHPNNETVHLHSCLGKRHARRRDASFGF
jgi:hypothetical protein